MELEESKIEKYSKRLVLLNSIVIIIVIHSSLLVAYMLDLITIFVLLAILFVMMVISLILFIIFIRNKVKRLHIIFVFTFLTMMFGYELILVGYESHTYAVTGYNDPEELLKGSGINILAVKVYDIQGTHNKKDIIFSLESENNRIFNFNEVTNRIKYISRTNDLLRLSGLAQDDFLVMGENVKRYVQGEISFINEFLSRENSEGSSAGLALGLSALIYQNELENKLTFGVTGTLERNGDVKEIGMVEEKMLISEHNHFPHIILPAANLEEAEKVKAENNLTIQILPVNTIDEAVSIIKELNSK